MDESVARPPIAHVIVVDGAPRRAREMDFCLQALQAAVGDQARWHTGMSVAEAPSWLADAPAHQWVLLLAHPWISIGRHTLARLAEQLALGSAEVVQACDNRNPTNWHPMRPPDYATLRGLDRYADSHAVASHAVSTDVAPLVALTTVGALPRVASGAASRAVVTGAFAHDASGYFANDRAEMLPLVPPQALRFLDVGGGEGGFLRALQAQRPGAVTVLAEQDAQTAERARAAGVGHVIHSDFMALRAADVAPWAPQGFDVVSFLDVLEHLVEPQYALRQAASLLGADGCVLASVPNVGHWSVLADLLEGHWDYAPAGIHCITHLRFFTRSGLHRLMAQAGLRVEAIQGTPVPMPEHFARAIAQRPWGGLQVDGESLNTYAWLVRAVPA